MSVFSSIGSFFKKIGHYTKGAFLAAGGRGFTDEVLQLAIGFVRSAADSALTNEQKRETVVKLLVARGVPESIARFAVELAVQFVKKELASVSA